MAAISSRRMKELRTKFELLDLNGDHKLDFSELKELLQRENRDLIQKVENGTANETLKSLFADADLNGDGYVNFHEFLDLVHFKTGASVHVKKRLVDNVLPAIEVHTSETQVEGKAPDSDFGHEYPLFSRFLDSATSGAHDGNELPPLSNQPRRHSSAEIGALRRSSLSRHGEHMLERWEARSLRETVLETCERRQRKPACTSPSGDGRMQGHDVVKCTSASAGPRRHSLPLGRRASV